jgi:hypothetical protein
VFSGREENLGQIFGPNQETSLVAGKATVVFQREVDAFHHPVMKKEVPIHLVSTRPEKPHE